MATLEVADCPHDPPIRKWLDETDVQVTAEQAMQEFMIVDPDGYRLVLFKRK